MQLTIEVFPAPFGPMIENSSRSHRKADVGQRLDAAELQRHVLRFEERSRRGLLNGIHGPASGAARCGATWRAMKPSIVCGPPAFDRFLTGLTRSKAAVGTMGRLWRNSLGGGGVQL